MLRALIVTAILCLWALPCGAAPNPMRLRDLPGHLDKRIQVKGRTGVIVEAEEGPGRHVFTLRDDYNGMIHVQYAGPYPIMGTTILADGIPRRDPQTGIIYFEAIRIVPAYRWVGQLQLMIAGIALLLIIAIALWFWYWRTHRTGELSPAWGYAEVLSGLDQGKVFALRGTDIVVGRKQDPTVAVGTVLDRAISRNHGRILREGTSVYYEDTHSKFGSWINEQPIPPGQRMSITPNDRIRLGRSTVIRVGEVDSEASEDGTEDFDALHGTQGEDPTSHDARTNG